MPRRRPPRPRTASTPAAGPDASVRYHNRVARRYASMYEDAYWRFHDDVTWHALRPLLPADANARCADLGCGAGKWGHKLAKSGFPVTFVDHAPAMVAEARSRLEELGNKGGACDTLVADIVDLSALPDATFALTLAMGDPISICSDPARAAAEMYRLCRPGGVVVATADNRLAAADAYLARGDLDGLEAVLTTGRTRWVTGDVAEQFPLTTFTPAGFARLFERVGFEVRGVYGKTILPVRASRDLLDDPGAYKRLLALEVKLGRDPTLAARAAHLQVVAVRPAVSA